MKPRPGWIIAEGAASARRKDGVEAGFYFLGDDKPYSAKKGFVFTRRGKQPNYLRQGTSFRKFSTLHGAMAAADRAWPPT